VRSLTEYDRIYDGCIMAQYRHKQTGELVTQRKRRPASAGSNECTWHSTVHCDDHPYRASERARALPTIRSTFLCYEDGEQIAGLTWVAGICNVINLTDGTQKREPRLDTTNAIAIECIIECIHRGDPTGDLEFLWLEHGNR